MAHKLLLADDSVTIQRVIELTFADEDVDVVAVGDGKKAIASIQADRPDIVLADVGMPERDGYEVAAFIKGNPQFANIPVLLLTGAFEPIDETRARAVGCDGVLVKPFEPQMVINRVKDLLAGRRPTSAWGSPAAQAPIRQAPSAEPEAAPAPPAAAAQGGSLEDYFDRLDAAFANLDGSASSDPGPSTAAAPVPPPAAAAPSLERVAPAAPSAQPAGSAFSADDLDGWDPDLVGDPKAPAFSPASSSGSASPAVAAVPVAPAPVSAPPPASAPAAVPAPAPTSTTAPVPTPAPVFAPPPEPPAVPEWAAPAPAAAEPVDFGYTRAPEPPPMPSQPAPIPASTAGGPSVSLADAFAALLSAEQSHAIKPSTLGRESISYEALDDIVQRVVARMNDQIVRETVVDVAERLVREEIERIKRDASVNPSNP